MLGRRSSPVRGPKPDCLGNGQAGDEEAIVVRLPNGDDPTDRGIAAALGRFGSWWDHWSRTQSRGCRMKSRADCECLCHSGGIELHVVQCCDGIASLLPRKADPQSKEPGSTASKKIKLIQHRYAGPLIARAARRSCITG